jgi:Zn-finger nucleic acid-binding protein
MTRTAIDLQTNGLALHLERCGNCRGVWFDAGEWSALADRELLEHIDEFWSVEWRASQRRERDRMSYELRQSEEFGQELHEALKEIALKLKGHKRRSQALAFIRDASSD